MFNFLVGSALWRLVTVSDWVSKVTLLLLLCMSIACWTIFFYKRALFRRYREQMARALQGMRKVSHLQEALILAEHLGTTLPGYFLNQNIRFL